MRNSIGRLAPMRCDECVHPTRIIFEVSAILRRRNLQRFLRGHLQPQNSLLTVVLEEGIAQNLGNFAGGEAPHHVHLPQTVLRCDIPLRKKEVVEICGLDGGHAVSVTNDCDPGGETGNLQPSVQLGQGRARHRIEPGQRPPERRAIGRRARTQELARRRSGCEGKSRWT